MITFFDRRLWAVPLALSLLGAAGFFLLIVWPGSWHALTSVRHDDLSSLMSSLAGTSGSLLGLVLAAVSILISMAKSGDRNVARARWRVAAALLAEAMLLTGVLSVATLMIIKRPNDLVTIVLLALLVGAASGLLVVGSAFALAVWEAGKSANR